MDTQSLFNGLAVIVVFAIWFLVVTDRDPDLL